jgi:hypothetical protein
MLPTGKFIDIGEFFIDKRSARPEWYDAKRGTWLQKAGYIG